MNSLEGPAMTILQDGAVLEARSIHEALHQGLVEVLVRRCCEDPGEIL